MLFIICGICGVFVVTLMWIVQNCLLTGLVSQFVLIIAIHFCMILLDIDLTKLQCVQNQLAHLVTKSPHLLTVFHCFVPFIGCQ